MLDFLRHQGATPAINHDAHVTPQAMVDALYPDWWQMSMAVSFRVNLVAA